GEPAGRRPPSRPGAPASAPRPGRPSRAASRPDRRATSSDPPIAAHHRGELARGRRSGRDVGGHAASRQDDDPIRPGERPLQVVGGEKNGAAPLALVVEESAQEIQSADVHTGAALVPQHHRPPPYTTPP